MSLFIFYKLGCWNNWLQNFASINFSFYHFNTKFALKLLKEIYPPVTYDFKAICTT